MIEAAIERAAAGEGSLVLIEGAAGIGKTRLLAEAKRSAGQRGFLTRSARGGELERDMPFGIARQLFEPVVEQKSEQERSKVLTGSAELALIALGAGEEPTAPSDPFAPIHGLYWLLANLSEEAAVLLAIDDIHWADPQSLRFLDYLARRLPDLRALVVANVRLGEPAPPPELESLRLEAYSIHPLPLSESAVSKWMASALGTATDANFAAACVEATAGNPFLLVELLRAIEADDLGPHGDARSLIQSLAPDTVGRQVLMRLGRFGRDAVELARAIAVLGGSPQLRHAAALAEIDETRAAELCDKLRRAEILSPGLPLDFVHPLVRQAVYSDLSEDQRSAWNRRAALVLADAGAGAREVAPHLFACTPNGDQWVVDQLGSAAWEAVASGAYDGAVSYLQRALAEPPVDDLPLRLGLGRALIQAEPPLAPRVLDEVWSRASDERMRRRALRDAGFAYFIADDWHAAIDRFKALLDSVPEAEAEQRAALEAQLLVVGIGLGRRDAKIARLRSTMEKLDESSPAKPIARQALGLDLLFFGGAHVEEVIEMCGSFPPPPWGARTMVSMAACMALACCGEWQRARSEIIRTADLWSQMAASTGYVAYFRAECERRAGRLADAEVEARNGLEIAAAVSISNPGSLVKISLLSALIDQGNLEEAQTVAGKLDLSAGIGEIPTYPWPLEIRGHLRLAVGQLEEGATDLLDFGQAAEQKGFLNPAAITWRYMAAPALAALGRTSEAKEIITVAEDRARGFGAAHVLGIVLRSRAAVESRERAIATLRDSVGLLEQHGPPHELARSMLELGSALRRAGSRSEARQPLQRALELAHTSGASGLERRTREELAAAGSRPRRVFRTGMASLTASELRIARLAAEGLNNREIAERLFVTRRTVETHLTHVYAKLDIEGRGQLAAAMSDGSARPA